MSVLDNFANIGKAVLIQALGLQKNYAEVVENTIDVIDYNTPACAECKQCAIINSFSADSEVYAAAASVCCNCPNKTLTTETTYKKIYHNEKNRYGYKPRLKSNAIKLLLLFHFYHPDRFGIIKDVMLDDLATALDCDIKTIRNNLEILKQYGYISFCKTSPHYITLCLTDYENYYLSAKQGGRGFFVLSRELLFKIFELDNLLSLRIHLRELIDMDNLNAKGPFTAVSKTFKELRRLLPEYCKPCNIKKAIDKQDGIFNISFKTNEVTHEKSIKFEIKDCFNSRKQKQQCLEHYINMFSDFMHDFNSTVGFVNSNNTPAPKYNEFFDTPSTRYRLIVFRDFELEDLAQLALQYSYDMVITAYSQIYKTYILNEQKIINLGGLVRTAIIAIQQSHMSNSQAA